MSESMRSYNEIEQGGGVDVPRPNPLESPASSELSPSVVVEQFLTQCRHTSVKPKEELAEFILASLSDAAPDEWTALLQSSRISPDDNQFEALVASDRVFIDIFNLLVRTKQVVGRGESMSKERRALIELMDLRAGEVLTAEAVVDEPNHEHWKEVLAKLFPDLT